MLNKKNRIGNRTVIDRLFRKGDLFKNRFFIFKYEKVTGEPCQFAVTVSKKTQKKAVKRNRLRRRVQEAIRLSLPLVRQPVKALVIARPACEKASYQELSEAIVHFFNFLASDAE